LYLVQIFSPLLQGMLSFWYEENAQILELILDLFP
jgi:hypothetical protein